jgi:hypothetical protein
MGFPRAKDGVTPLFGKQILELGREPFKHKDTGSEAMNVDGVAAGSAVVLWNGTGALDSGGDWTHENEGTETAGSMHSGTNGLDSGVRALDDWTRFNNGTNIDVAGTYDQVDFWMMPKAYPVGSKLRVRWEKVDGTNIGVSLKVEDYVSNMDLDVWQQVTIPIDDFGLTEDVGKFSFKYAGAAGQKFYFDDIDVVASSGGGPHVFRVGSPTGFIWHVERVVIVLSAGDTGWGSNAFADIAGGLNKGLLLRHKKIGDEVYWKVNCKNNVELFGQLHVLNNVTFDTPEQLFAFSLEPNQSAVVLVDDDEVLDIVVRDDLSSLNNLRAFLHYGEEILDSD